MTVHPDLEARLGDVMLELGVVASRIGELVDVVSGAAVALPQAVKIDATRNPWEWRTTGGVFHAIKIDNPAAVAVAVAFSSDNGATPGNAGADELVPAHMGRVITRPFEVVSIGFDPAVVPGGVTTLYVTLYARQLSPASYAFV